MSRPQHMQPFGKLFFISVRDPLEQYLSLYSFGRTHPGSPLRGRLVRLGLAELAQDRTRINASPRIYTGPGFHPSPRIVAQVREREWFLYKLTEALHQDPQTLLR